jgi:hypothetical protein
VNINSVVAGEFHYFAQIKILCFMKYVITIIAFLFVFQPSRSQTPVQTVKGRVVEKETKAPLAGAIITMLTNDSASQYGATADNDGYFKINNIPVGKQNFKARYIGYTDVYINDIIVGSGKEVWLNIEMEESINKVSEVEIKAAPKGAVKNEMATVSVRTFDVAETERYAGSRQDPARMASNFAGAQGTNDTRNDIVIRGNSPLGVVWRMDDATIPNPNHFAIAGTTGGPVSILNNKTISNSDFFTGAFPAEYGNGIAAVFDLKMRNGNSEKYEGTFQLGFLGTELALEGPINRKKRSSFTATYRYSTLKLFEGLNIKLGTDAVPNYQDFSFRFNFPLNDKSSIAFWGIGGSSKIDIIFSNILKTDSGNSEKYGLNDRDQFFRTSMYTFATSYNHTFSNKTYLKMVVSQSMQRNSAIHVLTLRDSATNKLADYTSLGYRFITNITGFNGYINHKFSSRANLKAGTSIDYYFYDLLDSSINEQKLKSSFYPVLPNGRYDLGGPFNTINPIREYDIKYATKRAAYLIQPYIQYKYRFKDDFFLTGGLHFQYFSLNKEFDVEPRFGMSYKLSAKQNLSFGSGLHSQTLPAYMYFYRLPQEPSKEYFTNVKNMKSFQNVISYDNSINQHTRVKIEAYYQYLFNVPVLVIPSSFSMINQGSGFTRIFPDTTLQNSGTGKNLGIEITLERFFYKNYYLMSTFSLYDSKYKGSDGKTYNSDFNGNYAFNFVGGYEYKIKEGKKGYEKTIISGGKFTIGGGKRYSPADTLKTIQRAEYTASDQGRNSLQFDPYLRFDLKLGYRINTKKMTHEFALDIVNLFNIQNYLTMSYSLDPKTSDLVLFPQTQLGRLTLFYYKLEFGLNSKK